MERRLKLMIILSLAGITLLMLLAHNLQPKTIAISDINNKMLDENVALAGNITGIRSYNNDTFFILILKDSTGNITITASSDDNFKDKITIHQSVLITGRIQEYNSSLQLNAEKIVLLRD